LLRWEGTQRGASEPEICHRWASRHQPRNQSESMKDILVDTQQDDTEPGAGRGYFKEDQIQ
ncbi:unnamed protein product, partial [Tetraodon nigroviridis]